MSHFLFVGVVVGSLKSAMSAPSPEDMQHFAAQVIAMAEHPRGLGIFKRIIISVMVRKGGGNSYRDRMWIGRSVRKNSKAES